MKVRCVYNVIFACCLFCFALSTHSQVLIQSKSTKTKTGVPENYNWRSIGPSGMPTPLISSEQYGVGQIHRIEFDPGYNGTSNTTVYAASSFGGLWRSENDGLHWDNVNTDYLPSTSVADVCINPFDRNEIFICTGYADGSLYAPIGPNWTHINPIPTTGIHRSRDYGKTWEDISDGFIGDFKSLGMCRKMMINPLNPDEVFVATTRGVYKCSDATGKKPSWKRVLGGHGNNEDFRGLAFKPDDANIIYACGKDIWMSSDGGSTWDPMTGNRVNLDLKNLPDSFAVNRINIAVTPAAPDRLYAYIEGKKTVKNKTTEGAHIAVFRDGRWDIVDSRFSSGVNYFADCWIAIAVSPVDADQVYYGHTRVIGTEKLDSIPFDMRSVYCGGGFHADVHDLEFQPNVANPKLFCGNHGGVSVKSLPNPTIGSWEYRNEGLAVATLWSFDDSGEDKMKAIIATQDCGTLVMQDTLDYQWQYIMGGDGYTARIDDRNPNIAYFSGGDRSLFRFDFVTRQSKSEISKLPKDPRNNKDVVISVKTFPMVNLPPAGNPVFGFTELFTRQVDAVDLSLPVEEIWTRISDLSRSEQEAWKRQITEIAFSHNQPEVLWVVTGGQQNPPGSVWQLKSSLYLTTTGGEPEDGKNGFIKIAYPGENLDNDTLAIITGIAVHPADPKQVWITFTGINGDYRVWKTDDGGKTWKNDDPEKLLALNPVNAIGYFEGKKNRLYIGTDRGLYTKSIGGEWQKVTSFPNVRITELKVNSEKKYITVATFGRGLWKGVLPD